MRILATGITGFVGHHLARVLQEAGHEIVGVVSVLDRLAGGAERIAAAAGAPYVALTTIDDVHPERPDR